MLFLLFHEVWLKHACLWMFSFYFVVVVVVVVLFCFCLFLCRTPRTVIQTKDSRKVVWHGMQYKAVFTNVHSFLMYVMRQKSVWILIMYMIGALIYNKLLIDIRTRWLQDNWETNIPSRPIREIKRKKMKRFIRHSFEIMISDYRCLKGKIENDATRSMLGLSFVAADLEILFLVGNVLL